MFTFGREHELKCALNHIGNEEKARPLLNVIDLVHDVVEGNGNKDELIKSLKVALVEGSSGVWESAGCWLKKLGKEDQDYLSIWLELTNHPKSTVRFRVASFVGDMPTDIGQQVFSVLSKDESKKVREHVAGKWEFIKGNDH